MINYNRRHISCVNCVSNWNEDISVAFYYRAELLISSSNELQLTTLTARHVVIDSRANRSVWSIDQSLAFRERKDSFATAVDSLNEEQTLHVLRSRVTLFFILPAHSSKTTFEWRYQRIIFRSKNFCKASITIYLTRDILQDILHSFSYLHFPSLRTIITQNSLLTSLLERESSVHNRIVRFRLLLRHTRARTRWEEDSRGFSLPLKVAHPSFGHVISILARCLWFLRAWLTYDRGDLAYWRLISLWW